MLLVEGVGIAGVPVLECRRLEEAHRRQVAGVQRGEEVVDVVLMIGGFGIARAGNLAVADRRHRARARMGRIARRGVVLERLVVRNVVGRVEGKGPRRGRIAEPLASRRPVGVDDREIETALEPAPGDASHIEQIADVAACHRDLVDGRVGAGVEQRIGIADHREIARAFACVAERLMGRMQQVARTVDHILHGREAVGLARDQVDGARRGGAELRGEVVVAQRIMLRIVPQRRDGVAVVVTHDEAFGRNAGGRRARGADPGREAIHVAVVIGALLGALIVSLVRRERLRGRQAKRIGRAGAVQLGAVGGDWRIRIAVGILVDQVDAGQRLEAVRRIERRQQSVDALWRAPRGFELRLARIVLRHRVSCEIMIEGDVLLKDHDQMLDRCRGTNTARGVVVAIVRYGTRRRSDEGCRKAA